MRARTLTYDKNLSIAVSEGVHRIPWRRIRGAEASRETRRPTKVDSGQYRGTLGSIFRDQSSIPPVRFVTSLNPSVSRYPATAYDRPPWWQ
jgi:hypothetical protein